MKKLTRTHKTKDEKRRLLLTKKNVKQEARVVKYGSDSVGTVAANFNKRFVAAFMALVFALSVLVVGVNFSGRAADEVNRTYLVNSGSNLEDGFAMLDDVDSTDGMVLRKGLKKNNDGTYDLRMEAYATGESKEVSEQIPTDFVLVIDQSGSMSTEDMPVGDSYSSAGSSFSISTIANSDDAYYYKDSSSGTDKYYRVYAKRGYMYNYVDANSYYMDDLFNKYKHFNYFANETVYQGSNGYYYKGTDGKYYLMYLHVKGTAVGSTSGQRWFAYNCYLYYDDESGTQHQITNDSCTGAWNDWHGSITYYVYRQFAYQRYSIFHSCKFGHPLYKRYIGYNELCYKDEDGEEHSLIATQYCNSSGTPVTSEGGSTEAKYGRTLYKANSTESRLSALNTSAKAFIDLVASQTNTKANGTTERVDHRIAVVGFASDNTSTYTYNNNELLSPDTSVEDNTSFAGTSLDGKGHDGPQYGSSEITSAYSNALVSTKTEAGATSLKTSIDYVTAYGGTEPETGFEMAYNVLNSRSSTDKQYTKMDGTKADRNTVVIFFTDGRPGNYSYSNQYEAANKVVDAARNIKNDLGTPVYSIGVFGESDGNPLTYSKYQITSYSSNDDYDSDHVYYTYKNYQSDDGDETFDEILTEFSYDIDYYDVTTYEWWFTGASSTKYTNADLLYRIWRQNSSGYSSTATDTIADYMRTVSSEYPDATAFVDEDWYDSDTSKRSGTYDNMVTSVRGTKGSGKYYYIATSASALTTAFSDIFESTIGEGTTSSVTYNDTNSYLQDIITDQFDTSNATGTVTVYSANNITDVTDGNPIVNSWTLVDPTPSGIDVSYSSNTVTDSDFKKTWTVEGFDYSSHYVAAANSSDAQKVVLTISGLTTTNVGLLTTNESTSGLYSIATTSGEDDSMESAFPIPTTTRAKYDLQYTGDNASGTDVTVMLKLSVDGLPVSGTFGGLTFNSDGLVEWTDAADDSELIVEDLPSNYKLESYVINNDSSGSYEYTLKLDDTVEDFWKSTSTTNAFELTETEQTITINSVLNNRTVTLQETVSGPYSNDENTFSPTLILIPPSGTTLDSDASKTIANGITLTKDSTENYLVGQIDSIQGDGANSQLTLSLPAGWTLKITQSNSGTYYEDPEISYTKSGGNATAYDETNGISVDSDMSITIHNPSKSSIAPETGFLDNANHMSLFMYVVAGILIIAACIAFLYNRKKQNKV